MADIPSRPQIQVFTADEYRIMAEFAAQSTQHMLEATEDDDIASSWTADMLAEIPQALEGIVPKNVAADSSR